MAAAAMLENQSNDRISVAVAYIDTILCSETEIGVSEPEMHWNVDSDKNQDGGRSLFREHINRHNLEAVWDIFTKFGTEVDTGRPPLTLTSKIGGGGPPIF